MRKLFLFTILPALISTASADERERGNLFGDNFAKSPIIKESDKAPTTTKDPTALFKKKGISQSDNLLPEGEKDSVTALASNIPAKWIGVILNGEDEQHYVENLERMVSVIDRFDLLAGTIHTVGRPSGPEAGSLLGKLIFRGGVHDGMLEWQEKYNVSMSPTWIVGTEKGIYLLEGINDLQRYFTPKGEFIEKPQGAPTEPKRRPIVDRGANLFE